MKSEIGCISKPLSTFFSFLCDIYIYLIFIDNFKDCCQNLHKHQNFQKYFGLSNLVICSLTYNFFLLIKLFFQYFLTRINFVLNIQPVHKKIKFLNY